MKDRKWIYPSCGEEILRDYDTAINLKNYISTKHREFTTMEIENKSSISDLALKTLSEKSKTVIEVVTENCEVSDTNPLSL